MKNLLKWQMISLISRGVAMGLGIFQSFFIVRILTVSEYGLVQLAASIGGAFGIYQHLGLSSGSTREISAADKKDIFKIFLTSAMIRYFITVPIAIGLFFGAPLIAEGQYMQPSLIFPLKIYSAVLLVQGVQGILNSVISGTKRFKLLFIFQAIIAVVSVVLYVPLVYLYRVNGYFYALFAFNLISSITLMIVAFKPYRKEISLPTKSELKIFTKELLSISLGIYIVKVIYTLWEKSGPLLLGVSVDTQVIGVFAFALLYAKKLIHASDAVTDINLPVLSEKYINDLNEFKFLFSENFNKVFVFIILAGTLATYWSTELIQFVVGGHKYDESLPLIIPMIFTFIFYSFINIIKSSVYIPAKYVKDMVIGYSLLLGTTVLGYLVFSHTTSVSIIYNMSYALLIGSLVSFSYLVYRAHKKIGFNFFKLTHILIMIQAFLFMNLKDISDIYLKIMIFIGLVGLYSVSVFYGGFISREDIVSIASKLKRKHE